MKIIYFGLVLLCLLALVCAATENPVTDSKSNQAAQQSAQPSDKQVSTPAPSQSGHNAAILSREEANSMRVQEDSLLAQSDVAEIKVGSIDNTDLLYILLIVLVVVVILRVAL